jgi:hypothetical protein
VGLRHLPLLVCLLAACGPTRSTSMIVEATAELAAADTAQAPTAAPYEYVAAEAYLHKAKEEQSYSDFEFATQLAEKARDCARAARAKAESVTRKEIGATQSTAPVKGVCRAGPKGLPPTPKAVPTAATPAASPAPASVAPPAAPPPVAPVKPVKPKEPNDPLPEGEP